MGDVGKVALGPPQPVETSDHERVAITQDGEHRLQLRAAVALPTAGLLLEDYADAGSLSAWRCTARSGSAVDTQA